MSNPAHTSSQLPLRSMIFAAGTVLLVLHMLLSGILAPGGHYRPGSSFRHYDSALIGLSALLCATAPLFSKAPFPQRMGWCVIHVIAFIGMVLVMGVFSILIFGLPDQD